MSDKTKPGREGDSLVARHLRHKDQAFEGLSTELLLKLKPSGAAPKEWTAFLAASSACHKAMDVLKDNPESQPAYDEAIATTDAFAAAARAWQAVAQSAPASEPASEPADEETDDGEGE